MKTTLFSLLLLLTLALSAHAQRYVCGLSCVVTTRGVGLGAAPTTFHRRDLLNTVAATGGRSLDPATLQLVYDTAAKQFQVVQKADGALVAVVYAVSDEKDYNIRNVEFVGVSLYVLRQASLQEPGAAGAVGTIGGVAEVVTSYDNNLTNPQTRFIWNARFSVLSATGGVFLLPQASMLQGFPAPLVSTPSLVQGQFSVRGVPFTPSGK